MNVPPPPPAAPAAPDANAQIAAALNHLTTIVQNLQAGAAGGGGGGGGGGGPILDPFASANPFDLSSRAGSNAFTTSCAALDVTWDGTTNEFPSFITALRQRAAECYWDSNSPQGILLFATAAVNVGPAATNRNLLTQHYAVTDAEIAAARVGRSDGRAIQNSQAMYHTIKKSISGDIKAMIFEQSDNVPTHQDGPTLFKLLMSFTIAASIQLAMMCLQQIITFDPASCKFNVQQINSKMTNLFTLATTNERTLSDPEKIQHLLTTYARIKQPEQWAQWVRNKMDAFDDGTLVNCQQFMNAAALKYIKVSAHNSGSFGGRSTTLAEDVVAMVALKRKVAPTDAPKEKAIKKATTGTGGSPPFLLWAKDQATGTAYKVGDTKDWKGTTYHFCDTPTHKRGIKWHRHSATECKTRQNWIATGSPPIAQANLADNDDATALTDPTGISDAASAATNGGASASGSAPSNVNLSSASGINANIGDVDITALLASALSVAPNDHTRNLIADALNSANDL